VEIGPRKVELMNMHRLRGISPVVATTLLILIAIATSVMLYVWLSGMVTSSTAGTEGLSQKFKIDTVYLDSGENITIVVRNTGDVPVKITAVYVYWSNGTLAANNTDLSATLNPGEVKPIDTGINVTDKDLENERVTVKVVSEYGVEAVWVGRLK
jgi:FlaG/FlaF family flagellin (archaellin)